MKQFDGIKNYIGAKNTVLVMGMFDGLHVGHLALIDKAKEIAHGRTITVLTFANHFKGVKQDFPLLLSKEEKQFIFSEMGVDNLIIQKVDKVLMDTTAEEFIELLQEHISIGAIVVGFDYTFGQGGVGDGDMLKAHFEHVHVVEEVDVEGEKASSTRMREAVQNWDYKEYTALCGQPYFFLGAVGHGNHIGRENDTPTINLPLGKGKFLPPDGVYIARVLLDGKEYDSVANLGSAPTFSRDQRVLEVHMLNYSGNAYNKTVCVQLFERLRDVKKFHSTSELYAQIKQDIDRTEKFFSHLK